MITAQFIGATRRVTGSKHIITTPKGSRILLDCGLFQGSDEDERDNAHLGFEPRNIDHCLLSHAHIDHSGALPLLIKDGYKGKIHCTEATKDLCNIMLPDSAHIQEDDVEYINKHRRREGRSEKEPLYDHGHAEDALHSFQTHPFHEWFELEKGVRVRFTLIGHILGASAINLEIDTENGTHRICYTGDVGRPDHPIIKPPEAFPQADTIITESTYGNRLHPKMEDSKENLLDIVEYTCVRKKGKLIIPAFSVGRTQEIIYALDQLETEGRLPPIDTFVDSPLSTNATEIVRNHPECYNEDLVKYLERDRDPFGFNRLTYIRKVKDSIALNDRKRPCIIISASGMMEAGRVQHHLVHAISNPANTLLIVGYSEPESLGGKFIAGDKEVEIFGKKWPVKMDVKIMEAYSAHGDQKEMLDYLSCQEPEKVSNLFLVHGNYEAQSAYKEKLQEKGFSNIEIPMKKQEFKIS